MSLRKIYATDTSKEENGVDVEIGVNEFNGEPMIITVAHMSQSNQKYQSAFSDKFDPYMDAIQDDRMDEKLARKLMRELYVDDILKNVKNVPLSDLTDDEADNEKIMPFTAENVHALFDKYPHIFPEWQAKAKRFATFRAAAKEKAAGN